MPDVTPLGLAAFVVGFMAVVYFVFLALFAGVQHSWEKIYEMIYRGSDRYNMEPDPAPASADPVPMENEK